MLTRVALKIWKQHILFVLFFTSFHPVIKIWPTIMFRLFWGQYFWRFLATNDISSKRRYVLRTMRPQMGGGCPLFWHFLGLFYHGHFYFGRFLGDFMGDIMGDDMFWGQGGPDGRRPPFLNIFFFYLRHLRIFILGHFMGDNIWGQGGQVGGRRSPFLNTFSRLFYLGHFYMGHFYFGHFFGAF